MPMERKPAENLDEDPHTEGNVIAIMVFAVIGIFFPLISKLGILG